MLATRLIWQQRRRAIPPANGVGVAERGVIQQWILLDERVETVANEQGGDRLQVRVEIDLDHQLTNPGPIGVVQPAQYVKLALLDVDLQKIDAIPAPPRPAAGQPPR